MTVFLQIRLSQILPIYSLMLVLDDKDDTLHEERYMSCCNTFDRILRVFLRVYQWKEPDTKHRKLKIFNRKTMIHLHANGTIIHLIFKLPSHHKLRIYTFYKHKVTVPTPVSLYDQSITINSPTSPVTGLGEALDPGDSVCTVPAHCEGDTSGPGSITMLWPSSGTLRHPRVELLEEIAVIVNSGLALG